jgi:hypothetical protein
MAITYTWEFTNDSLSTKQSNGMSDVIYKIKWRLIGTESDSTWTTEGEVDIDAPASDTFIPFSGLDSSTVEGWVETALGTDGLVHYKELLKQQIDNSGSLQGFVMKPYTNQSLPWEK